MASNTPFKPKQDKEYNIDKDTVNAIIKKRFNTEKKPTKFTLKSFTELGPELNPFLLIPGIKEKIEKYKENPSEENYIDFFADLDKAGASGLQKLGYAIGDLVTAGIDLTVGRIGDTNLPTVKSIPAVTRSPIA